MSDYLLMLVIFGLTYDVCYTQIPLVDVSTNDILDILRTSFSVPRYEDKEQTRDFIKYIFEDISEEYQHFRYDEQTFTHGNLDGVNQILTFTGPRWGTHEDKPLLIGAHYDTKDGSPGVNDNGSGMAALLETAKWVSRTPCPLKNSILFVAFDMGEMDESGSDAFLVYLEGLLHNNSIPMTNFQGAIILDSVMNLDMESDSQNFPSDFQQILPDTYEQIRSRNNSGDFLAILTRNNENALASSLVTLWSELNLGDYSHSYILPFQLPISSTIDSLSNSSLQNIATELRSDHLSFWKYSSTNVTSGLKAVLLTDTMSLRGIGATCKHQPCDELDQLISDNNLILIQQTVQVVVAASLQMSSETNDCTEPQPDTTTADTLPSTKSTKKPTTSGYTVNQQHILIIFIWTLLVFYLKT